MASLITRLAAGELPQLFEALETAARQLGLVVLVNRVDGGTTDTLFLSASAEQLFGRPIDELRHGSLLRHLVPADQRRIAAVIASRDASSPPMSVEVELVTGDGSVRPAEVGVTRIASSLGELAVCFLRDVGARQQAIAALQRSEERFRDLVASAPDAVMIHCDGRIVFANAAAATLFQVAGPEDVVGKALSDLVTPADAARGAERLREMQRRGVALPPAEYTTLGDRVLEIKTIPWEWEGRPAALGFARDVSERNALQRRLVRADRLASLGTLAAAVAHEINNPLTYATLSLGRIEQWMTDARVDPGIREHLRSVRQGLDRTATIVRDLLAYAGDHESVAGPVDLPAVVERALKLVEHELRHRARIVRRFDPVPPADGDAGRLEQVIVNLLINASHALRRPQADERITIEVGQDAQGDVFVAVADTGCGIPSALRERIFEPFVTTKPLGQGTGLGLSVSRSMVEAMGGRIELDSREGEGTRVTVTLPRFDAATAVALAAPVAEPEALPVPGLRVLVVDDEALVRRVVRVLLEPHHHAVEVDGGPAALRVLAEERFDVVICDLMMPGMTGMELHAAIQRDHPGLERRMIFISGGAFVPALVTFLESVDNPRIMKPFDEEQLHGALRVAATR